MIFEVQNYYFILQDAVYSAGAGFLRGRAGRLLSGFLTHNKAGRFASDFLSGVIFSVLIFSYCVSFANYNVLRFYNVIFRLAGFFSFPKFVSLWADTFSQLFCHTVLFLKSKVKTKISDEIKKVRAKKLSKQQKSAQKSHEKVLSEDEVLLYN